MKTYLETEEVMKLEEATTNLRDRLLVRTLFHLGCRISEAVAISVDDIDLDQGTITILHLKTRIKLNCPICNSVLGRNNCFCPKCGSRVKEASAQQQEHRRRRILPIDRVTLGLLKEYIDRGGPVDKNGKKLIFGINRHRAWQIIQDCAHKAGLPTLINPETGRVHGVSPHRLRDAFAVHAVKRDDSGDSLRMLQEHLGHASFNTTARYRKVSGEEHRDWYERLWEEDDSNG
ncbi:MAG: tyrosine-type recombinase/integrase [Dehalococcoidales bacterium]|nr:tyrosine-type recombinase/integrase [Dehalococcoidales bacterium]